MDTITKWREIYAGVIGVCDMEDIYDCPSTGVFFDLGSFLVGVLEPYFSLPFDTDFSLPFDFDLDAPDLSDLF